MLVSLEVAVSAPPEERLPRVVIAWASFADRRLQGAEVGGLILQRGLVVLQRQNGYFGDLRGAREDTLQVRGVSTDPGEGLRIRNGRQIAGKSRVDGACTHYGLIVRAWPRDRARNASTHIDRHTPRSFRENACGGVRDTERSRAWRRVGR